MEHSGSTRQIRRGSPTGSSGRPLAVHRSVAGAKQRRVLDEHVRSIAEELSPKGVPADPHRAHLILEQIADIVGTGGSDITTGDYAHLLQHLTTVYAEGDARHRDGAFTASASGYARVIKAISGQCPGCDYRLAVGQLLDLMSRLFEIRHPSWKSIFRLLRAIPEAVNGRERLERVCSKHVPEWFDTGVPNLFLHRKELYREIEELDLKIRVLKNEIHMTEEDMEALQASAGSLVHPQIAILPLARKQGQIALWRRKMRLSLDERDVKARATVLIESEIRDLGNRLRTAARTYRLHLV